MAEYGNNSVFRFETKVCVRLRPTMQRPSYAEASTKPGPKSVALPLHQRLQVRDT